MVFILFFIFTLLSHTADIAAAQSGSRSTSVVTWSPFAPSGSSAVDNTPGYPGEAPTPQVFTPVAAMPRIMGLSISLPCGSDDECDSDMSSSEQMQTPRTPLCPIMRRDLSKQFAHLWTLFGNYKRDSSSKSLAENAAELAILSALVEKFKDDNFDALERDALLQDDNYADRKQTSLEIVAELQSDLLKLQ